MRVLILLYSLQPDIFLIPQHNIQNLIVRRLHPIAPHAAEAADGLLHVALHQTFAGLEGAVSDAHLHAQQSRLQRRGNLGGAGGLGPITDHAAHGGDGVGDGSAEYGMRVVKQVADAAGCAAGRADHAAVGGQAADVVLLMNRRQIGDHQGAQQLLTPHVPLLGVDDHGHADRDALVSAAGVDDHRHGTAVHPGVGAGGGVSAGLKPHGGVIVAD